MPVTDPEKRRQIRQAYYERHRGEPCTKCRKNPRRDNGAWCDECSREHTNSRYDSAVAKTKYDAAKSRARHLKKYGLTPETYDAMFERQEGCCALCGVSEPGGQGYWHVDHDHATGAVRGILCHACNVGLGNFKDSPSLLAKAISYLERSKMKKVANG